MPTLSVLSGGAAQGLVNALGAEFTARSGQELDASFGAVGAMRARLAGGHPTDIVILTAAILEALAADGVVLPHSVTEIGGVETAIAVRARDKAPRATDEATLRASLLAADAIYFPDAHQSTAGIHFAGVLAKLGVSEEVAGRLRTFPNGATAMAALAAAPETNPIGCTQVTEILSTPGVMLVTALPPGFDLTTRYTAGIVSASTNQDAALALIRLLISADNAALRARCGFV